LCDFFFGFVGAIFASRRVLGLTVIESRVREEDVQIPAHLDQSQSTIWKSAAWALSQMFIDKLPLERVGKIALSSPLADCSCRHAGVSTWTPSPQSQLGVERDGRDQMLRGQLRRAFGESKKEVAEGKPQVHGEKPQWDNQWHIYSPLPELESCFSPKVHN
jgi:hypothetical protein